MKNIGAMITASLILASGSSYPAAAKGNNLGSDQSKFDTVSEQSRKAKARREAASSFDGKKTNKRKK